MSRTESLGQFEQLVLTAVLSLEGNAYGVTIHKKVEALSAPRSVTLGAIYVTLDRLEDKGFLSSWLTDPTPERGGRAKRCYKVESTGEIALRESMLAARRMWIEVSRRWGGSMGINFSRRVVSALLPRDYREHVLGDLEEGGFHLGDTTSILPRVWLSHFRRTRSSRAPSFSFYGWLVRDTQVLTLFSTPEAELKSRIELLAGLRNNARFGHPYLLFVPSGIYLLRASWPSVTKYQQFAMLTTGILLSIGLANCVPDASSGK